MLKPKFRLKPIPPNKVFKDKNKYSRRQKHKKRDNVCTRCGASTSPLADNYFIPKCYCTDFDIMEGDELESDDYE